MQRILSMSAVALAAMTLAACGQAEHGSATGAGIGVGATSSSETGVSYSTDISRMRKMANSKDQKVALTVSASTYIDSAMAFGPNLNAKTKIKLGLGAPLLVSAADLQSLVSQLGDEDPFKPVLVAAQPAVAASGPAADKALESVDSMVRARMLYAAATRGVFGWQVQPPTSFEKLNVVSEQMAAGWMRAHEVGACVGAGLGGQLATAMSNIVLQDPVAARSWGHKFSAVVVKESAGDVLASCEQTYPLKTTRTVDATGKDGAAWSVQTADGQVTYMSCVSTGCEAVQNGVQLFGKGQYSGVTYQLAFARAAATSSERTQGTTSGVGGKDSDKSDASVSVGK